MTVCVCAHADMCTRVFSEHVYVCTVLLLCILYVCVAHTHMYNTKLKVAVIEEGSLA